MADLGITIDQLVAMYLPAGFIVSPNFITQQTKVYQLLYSDAAGVDEADRFNVEAYTEKWQLLIGYMVLWAILQKILLGSFIGAIAPGSSSDTETSTEGGIKKIVTGPTEVEYFGAAESLASILKALAGKDGIIQQIMGLACPLARSIGIKLPFCPAYKTPVPFEVTNPPTNPFGFKEIRVGGDYDKPKSMG